MSDLKMYIWEDVLCDYSCGMIAVLAESPEHAREIVRRDYDDHIYRETYKDPIEVKEPTAFYAYGGG